LWDLVLLQAGVMLVAFGLAAVLARRLRNRPTLERMAVSAMPVLVAMLAWHWVVAVGVLPYGGPWSAIRLAPSMSLRYGYRLYESRGLGPVLGWIYPPVAPLAYLPATLFGEPGAAVIAGRCLTLIYYYAPAVWLILSSRGAAGSTGRWIRVLLLFTFALITSQSTALSYCSTEVHADATALALGAAALGLLGRSAAGSGWAGRAGAVVVAALAVWSKQLTVVVFAVLPLWVLVRDGFRPALRFTAVWLAGGVAVSLLMLFLFPLDGLFYNIITIPSRHPWTAIHPVGIASVFVKMQLDHMVLWALIAAGLVLRLARREDPGGEVAASAVTREAWPLFLLVGLLSSPLAVLGVIKVGGYDNNLSYSMYYLALGGMLLLADAAGRIRPSDDDRAAPTLASVILGVNLLLAVVGSERLAIELAGGVYPGRDARDAIRYLRAHPGEAYFPWHPLEHLMIDGKATHSEYGVWDRKLAGDPMSTEHFLGYVPPDARLICYPDGITVAEQITLKYGGGTWRRRELPELPGWTCFERYDGRPVFPRKDR
jgi:hypothetical protein